MIDEAGEPVDQALEECRIGLVQQADDLGRPVAREGFQAVLSQVLGSPVITRSTLYIEEAN